MADTALEKPFLAAAKDVGLVALEGHRPVGGVRASIYNAMPEEGIEVLVSFMREFKRKHMGKPMFNVLTYNNIAASSLTSLPPGKYAVALQCPHPDAILLRSFDLQGMTIRDSVLAGAGLGAV